MMKLKIIMYLALLNINSIPASEITQATQTIVKCFHQQLGGKCRRSEVRK